MHGARSTEGSRVSIRQTEMRITRRGYVSVFFDVPPGGLAVFFEGGLLGDGFLAGLAGALGDFAFGVGSDPFLAWSIFAHGTI